MIKTILAHLTGTGCDASVLAASLEVAQAGHAHIEALCVLPDPGDLIREAAQIDLASATLLTESLTALEKQSKHKSASAKAAFAEFCKREKIAQVDSPPAPGAVSASYREITGIETEVLSEQGRFHDLLVLAGGKDRPGRLSDGDLGAIAVSCGRPILLAPAHAHGRGFKKIAIAWKNTPEAARALTAALPFLAKARHIEVLSANEGRDGSLECVGCTDNLVKHFHWHGQNAVGRFVIPAGRSVPAAVIETAREHEADLLVMSAYGHSRLREFVFGGFTRHVLEGVDFPVLIFH